MMHHSHTLDECRQLLSQLNDYVDGDLADDLCAVLEAHLGGCADCRIVLDSLTQTITLYRGLSETPIELPPGVEERLIRALEHDATPPVA